jgi:hypothetical protein
MISFPLSSLLSARDGFAVALANRWLDLRADEGPLGVEPDVSIVKTLVPDTGGLDLDLLDVRLVVEGGETRFGVLVICLILFRLSTP